MRRLPGWLLLGGIGAPAAALLTWLGFPAAFIFAGLIAGVACALSLPDDRRPDMPRTLRPLALGLVGVGAGALLTTDVLTTLGEDAPIVLGAVAATIVVSLAIGQILRFSPNIDGTTAVFASVAGGASGVVAVAREYRADERIVMALQYLRILVVLAIIPVVVSQYAPDQDLGAASGPSPDWSDYGFTALALGLGLGVAVLWRFSASTLLLPLVAAIALVTVGPFADVQVPAILLNAAYAAIGVEVGLGFHRGTLRVLGRIMPVGLFQVALTVGACMAVGLALSEATGLSRIDGFLATAPGGLPTAIAVAIVAGDQVAVVVAAQVIRMLAALFLAPALGVWFRRRGR